MSWCPDDMTNPIDAPMDSLNETLRRDVAASPDLTASIMHRIGFARCSVAETRRLRRRRVLRSVALLLTVATVLGFGIDFYRAHMAVRVPAGPTIPAALHQDVKRQHERLDATFRTIRRLAPPAQPAAPPPQPDPRAMAPVRWI